MEGLGQLSVGCESVEVGAIWREKKNHPRQSVAKMQKPRLVTSCDLLKMQHAQRLTLGLGNEHIRMQLPPVVPDLLCHSQGPSPIILGQIGVVQLQVTLAQLMAQPDCFLQPFAQGQLPFPPGPRTVQVFSLHAKGVCGFGLNSASGWV